MPKKIRELKSLLLKAGFIYQPAKGSHSKWTHPKSPKAIIIAGKDGDDAKRYLEKQVNDALEKLKEIDRGYRIMKYTIVIQWSDEDQCFVVLLPEFTDVMQPVTHGDTYEEALKNAQEVLELLIQSSLEKGEPLPKAKTLGQSFQLA